MTWLLVGLGNPGAAYAPHRHNVGFQLIDALAERYRFAPFSAKHSAQFSKGRIEDIDCILCKPQSYMNLSGQPAAAIARFFQIPPEQMLVFHDELDLPLAKIRIKQGGGNGGHNGLKSLDAHCGNGYWRLRFGIDRPEGKDDVSAFVLSGFSAQQQPIATQTIDAIATHLPLFFSQGAGPLMSKLALVAGE